MAKKTDPVRKRLILLDMHAIIHRAYHALPDFSSSKGEPTGALYGLVAMLLKAINELKPDYIVACYDLPGPTYRHEAYDEYKAGRAEADDALVAQINRSRDVLNAFGIPFYEKEGFEADDLLGTIVTHVKNQPDIDVIIASGDMDTLQLVDDKRVQVYTLKKGIQDTVLYDEDAVKSRFGFPPALLADFKGLRGDPSDNIPGIRGIGEKTACELIVTFGGIEEIYRTLKKNREAFEKAGIKPRIIKLLEEGEEEAKFSKMLATIRTDAPIIFSLPEKEWQASLDPQKALTLFEELSFRTLADRVRSLFGGVVDAKNGRGEQEEESVDEYALKETAIALWLLDSNITTPSREDILQHAKTQSFKEAREVIFKELKKTGLERVYEQIEKPLIPVVDRMYERGIKLDLAYLEALSGEYHKKLADIERNIYQHAGEEFNINSPKQLGDVLFEKMGLRVKNQKRTSTGQRSTRESELAKMRDAHPIIDEILRYRELQKLLSTYIDNIPQMADANGRLHARFLQTGTTTGRMASQNPNLQNIPIRTEAGRKIRNAFIADEDFVLVSCDYSQIELRIAAIISGDEKLIEVFRDGGDVHTAVAAEVFNVPPEHVDAEMRRRAKVINFGILYGMGVNALKDALGSDRKDAQQFLNEYFRKFSGIARYVDHIKADAYRRGYTETLFGRRRYFADIKSAQPHIKAAAERMAINAPIQGTQADVIKIAMVRIDEWLRGEGMLDDVWLLLQVHDELVYEVREAVVQKVIPQIKSMMETVLPLEETHGVPLSAEVKAGKSWGEIQKYEV